MVLCEGEFHDLDNRVNKALVDRGIDAHLLPENRNGFL